MFTIIITTPSNKRQWTMSHPAIDTVLAFMKHIRVSRGASVRVWSSKDKRFVV